MGQLTGMDSLSTSRNLELLPTITAIEFGQLDRSTGRFVNRLVRRARDQHRVPGVLALNHS